MLRLYPSFPIPAVSALIIRNDEILLVKRGASPGKGLWSLPGGVIEVGEDAQSALIREVFEETHLKIEVDDLFAVLQYVELDPEDKVRYHYLILVFKCHAIGSSKPHPRTDALEVRWVKTSSALLYELTKTSRIILEKLHKSFDRLYLGTIISRG